MYVTPAQLDEVRTLLMMGWFLTGLLYVLLNWDEWRNPKAVASEMCKLHQRPLSECISQHEEPDD